MDKNISAELKEAKRLVSIVHDDLKCITPDNVELSDLEYNQDDLKQAIIILNQIWETLNNHPG